MIDPEDKHDYTSSESESEATSELDSISADRTKKGRRAHAEVSRRTSTKNRQSAESTGSPTLPGSGFNSGHLESTHISDDVFATQRKLKTPAIVEEDKGKASSPPTSAPRLRENDERKEDLKQ